MTSPSPDLKRRLKNTKKLIDSGESNKVSQYSSTDPDNYIDLDNYNKIKKNKPWTKKVINNDTTVRPITTNTPAMIDIDNINMVDYISPGVVVKSERPYKSMSLEQLSPTVYPYAYMGTSQGQPVYVDKFGVTNCSLMTDGVYNFPHDGTQNTSFVWLTYETLDCVNYTIDGPNNLYIDYWNGTSWVLSLTIYLSGFPVQGTNQAIRIGLGPGFFTSGWNNRACRARINNMMVQFGFNSPHSRHVTRDKIVIVCVDFPNRPATKSISSISQKFFGGPFNNFKDYWYYTSNGAFTPDGEIIGNKWYRMPNNSTYYTASNYGINSTEPNDQTLFNHALDAINNDSTITSSFLASLDGSGNNILRVILVHSGAEGAATGSSSDFWAVTWSLGSLRTVKGMGFQRFFMSAEYIRTSTEGFVGFGTDCHEFGHMEFNLPDLYDSSGNSEGVGEWCLMGGGNWLVNSTYPAFPSAWTRIQLGMLSSLTTDPQGTVELVDVESSRTVVKIQTSVANEYFLLENRQQAIFDGYIPGNGLLIWHINDNQLENSNEACYKVGLVQADNLYNLENDINRGDAGDPYPGTTNNRTFNDTSLPPDKLCNNILAGKSVTSISNSSRLMSVNLPVICQDLTCTLTIN